MRIVYVGPHRAVTVHGIREPVEKDVPVEVTAALAASLLEQDIWQKAKADPAKAAKAATPDTATVPPDTEETT